jgi:ribosomal protein S18 acetylase RimI-like enzyme
MTTAHTRSDARRADPGEAAAVATVLTAAFHDDPVFTWLHPDPDTRAGKVHFFFALAVGVLARHDETWTVGEGTTGAALWGPRGVPATTEAEGEALGTAVAERVGPDDAGRLFELMALMDERHPHEPHEYLWFLGVHPAAQGRGLGSALLAPVLDRADRARSAAYLEATSPRNKALYERHGFVAAAPFAVAGGPPLWPMWREPR